MMSEIVKDFRVSPHENQGIYYLKISPQIQDSIDLEVWVIMTLLNFGMVYGRSGAADAEIFVTHY